MPKVASELLQESMGWVLMIDISEFEVARQKSPKLAFYAMRFPCSKRLQEYHFDGATIDNNGCPLDYKLQVFLLCSKLEFSLWHFLHVSGTSCSKQPHQNSWGKLVVSHDDGLYRNKARLFEQSASSP